MSISAPFDKQLKDTFKDVKKIKNLEKYFVDSNKHLINFHSERNILSQEMKGRVLYNNISELRDVATVMEHPEFYKFYYKYMQNWKSFKRMLVLMKIYDMISNYLYQKDPCEQYHNSYHKLVLLHNLLKSPLYSRLLFKNYVSDVPENISAMLEDTPTALENGTEK